MHGLLVGAMFGMGFVAFMGAWRSVENWRGSRRRPGKLRLAVQVGLQVALGLAAVTAGLWFLWFGE